MSAFQRKLDLLDLIPRAPRKITASRLADMLAQSGHDEVSLRKIQRDLESIEKQGLFGLEADKRNKPYGWSIHSDWKKLNISLMDANTALAFSTLKQVSDDLLPQSTLNELNTYFEKAEQILASEQRPLISHWRKSVAQINSPNPVSLPEVNQTVFNAIKQALFLKKQISADFKRRFGSTKQVVWKHYSQINPLGLIFKDNTPILVCTLGRLHPKIYSISISSINQVELTDIDAYQPEHFDFEEITRYQRQLSDNNNPIALVLKINKDSRLFKSEGKLSDDQIIDSNIPGRFALLSATVQDTPELRSLLRGLGTSVEIISPLTLRNYFTELAQELANLYQPEDNVFKMTS